MKGLLIILLIPVFWMIALPPALADERGQNSRYERSVVVNPGESQGSNPAIVAVSWNGSGSYGYYGRWDHRHRSYPYVDRHRHGYGNPRFYGHRHYHSPYRPHPFHGGGFYHRPHRGGHFGLSACYRSGSVLICINESRPYCYR